MYFTAGSLRRSLPSSTSFITDAVVAKIFVRDARSKIVSTVIASRCGRIARDPYARRCTTRPLWLTSSTAPGISSRAIALLTMSSRCRRESAASDRVRCSCAVSFETKQPVEISSANKIGANKSLVKQRAGEQLVRSHRWMLGGLIHCQGIRSRPQIPARFRNRRTINQQAGTCGVI